MRGIYGETLLVCGITAKAQTKVNKPVGCDFQVLEAVAGGLKSGTVGQDTGVVDLI